MLQPTDAQLDAFYGIPVEDTTSAANGVRNAIRAIRDYDMTEAVVAAILQTLTARLANGNSSHTDSTQAAIEFMDDAIQVLEAV